MLLNSGTDYTPTNNIFIIQKSSLLSTGTHSFYCKFSNGTCSQTTATETITVNPAITLVDDLPSSASACSGAIYGLVASASGGSGTLTNTWYGDGVLLNDGTDYTHSKNAVVMQKSSLLVAGQHSFYCLFSDGKCSKQTQTETVTVNAPPTMNPITNSSWVGQQGVGNDPNNDFWVQINPPAGTTGYMNITNVDYPQFNVSSAQITQSYPEVSTNYMNMPPGDITVEYWCVDANGCTSDHLTWQNPIWGTQH